MQVKTKNALFGALVVLLVGALWYKVVYSPMESKASKAKSAAHNADETSSNLRERISAVNAAKKKAKNNDVGSPALLAAVPADAAEASFLRGIDALRISSGADWQSIAPAVPVLSGTLTTINVSISVLGTEDQLMRYENGLYDLKRVFILDGLSISPNGSSAAPGSAAPPVHSGGVFSSDQLTMQITGRIFSQAGAIASATAGASGASGASGTSGTSAGATTPVTGAPAPTGVQNN